MNAVGRPVRQGAVAGEVFPNETSAWSLPMLGACGMAGLCRLCLPPWL